MSVRMRKLRRHHVLSMMRVYDKRDGDALRAWGLAHCDGVEADKVQLHKELEAAKKKMWAHRDKFLGPNRRWSKRDIYLSSSYAKRLKRRVRAMLGIRKIDYTPRQAKKAQALYDHFAARQARFIKMAERFQFSGAI